MKRIFVITMLIISVAIFGGCSLEDINDQVMNIQQAENEYVLGVKNGSPEAYPDKTYGDSFDNFFAMPAWKHFVGTQDGTDEDGDGDPDYKKSNVNVVEFTGYCTYKDVEVKALIQFTYDENGETFSATYLSFNDVPQNMLVLSALLMAAFEA